MVGQVAAKVAVTFSVMVFRFQYDLMQLKGFYTQL